MRIITIIFIFIIINLFVFFSFSQADKAWENRAKAAGYYDSLPEDMLRNK